MNRAAFGRWIREPCRTRFDGGARFNKVNNLNEDAEIPSAPLSRERWIAVGACLSAASLGLVALLSYALVYGTRSGVAASVAELPRPLAGRAFAAVPEGSALQRIPFRGGIAWRRMPLRAQLSLNGWVDRAEFEKFLASGPAVSRVVRSETEQSFTIQEPRLHAKGTMELASGRVHIVSWIVPPPRGRGARSS
jgi:hypothetical protein